MTALNITVTLDDLCTLTVTENSGYYDSVANPTGFLTEADNSSPTFGVYKLSEGYFLNVLVYNQLSTGGVIVNTNEAFYHVPSSVSGAYADNFTPSAYTLLTDGSYTLKRYFIISDVYYNAQSTSGIFSGKTIYYTDGSTLYQVVNGTPTAVTISAFVQSNIVNATVVEVDSQFISTCNINNCYYKLMSTILDSTMNKCYSKDYDKLISNRDLLFMTLECVRYLQGFGNITQVQKILEAVDGCCDICSTLTIDDGGCGCGQAN